MPGHLGTRVLCCPGWSVADLTRHVGEVYLHKVEMMRQGRHPDGWPPASFQEEEPTQLLDRGYAALCDEFTIRRPEDVSKTWYDPDQTVGFWVRRMAQETVIHRIDAELGAGAAIAPVPDDLAIDGIDELLRVFLAYSVAEWPEDFTEVLKGAPGRSYLIRTDATRDRPPVSWLVEVDPDHLTVEGGLDGEPAGPMTPDVTISGPAPVVLRWVWNRTAPYEAHPIRVDGDAAGLTEFQRCVVESTQ